MVIFFLFFLLHTELNSPSIMPFVFKGNMPTLKDTSLKSIQVRNPIHNHQKKTKKKTQAAQKVHIFKVKIMKKTLKCR